MQAASCTHTSVHLCGQFETYCSTMPYHTAPWLRRVVCSLTAPTCSSSETLRTVVAEMAERQVLTGRTSEPVRGVVGRTPLVHTLSFDLEGGNGACGAQMRLAGYVLATCSRC